MRDSRKTRDFMNLVHTHGHDKTIKGMALSNKGKAHLFRLHFRMGQVPISWKMVNVEGKTQGSAPSSQCIEPLVLAGPEVSNQNHWNQVGPKCVHGLRRDITSDSLSTWNLWFLGLIYTWIETRHYNRHSVVIC